MATADNVIGAFSEEYAAKLTEVSSAQLRYWHNTDFFGASFATEEAGVPYRRLYSFRDLVSLRVLYELRVIHRVPLSELRAASDRLGRFGENWLSRTLWVFDRKVIWREPGVGLKQEITTRQYVFEAIPLRAVASHMRRRMDEEGRRKPEEVGVVTRDRFIIGNRPVLAGTRISVDSVKHFADAGYSEAAILKEYPSLTPADVKAAVKYRDDAAAA